MKEDYLTDIKGLVFEEGLDKQYNIAHKWLSLGEYEPYNEFCQTYGPTIVGICRNTSKSRRCKVARCKAKIKSIIEGGKAWFITLTFKDEVLLNTTHKQRRRFVQRALKRVSKCYVGNVDYGDKAKNPDSNEREHYHAVVYSFEKPEFKHWQKAYGFIKVKLIGTDEEDVKKVAKYVAKLSHHALKQCTEKGEKPERLIYSRDTQYCPPAFLFLDDLPPVGDDPE